MVAENISLGVLALPQAIAVLGLVPGLLLVFFLGIIAGYTGYIIGQFKQAFPQVQSFADCGELIAGPIGREIMAVSQILILVFIMAAHVLSFAIAFNAITDHAQCTVLFSAIGLIVCFVLGLPRTLKNVSYLSIFCTSISCWDEPGNSLLIHTSMLLRCHCSHSCNDWNCHLEAQHGPVPHSRCQHPGRQRTRPRHEHHLGLRYTSPPTPIIPITNQAQPVTSPSSVSAPNSRTPKTSQKPSHSCKHWPSPSTC